MVLTQLADMLKFGLDKLLQSEDSSSQDLDFQQILGGSVAGKWIVDGSKDEPEEEEKMEEDDEDLQEERGMVHGQ